METEMDTKFRAVLMAALFAIAQSALAADGVAFIANLKGEVVLDGTGRPALMAELPRGQKIVLGKDASLSVMFIQSGKEFALKGPGRFVVNSSDISASNGAPPAVRETEWRTNSQVLVQVSQSSSASIRMRRIGPAKADDKAALVYPIQGKVSTLQPTFRWNTGGVASPFEFTIAPAADRGSPLNKARVAGDTYHLPVTLNPDSEYAWRVTAADTEIGSGMFRTLPQDALSQAENRKPHDKAEFSDRLMYALMLQEMGATQDAQEIWSALAQERADLPELAVLSKGH
jgi:hypothetical protein